MALSIVGEIKPSSEIMAASRSRWSHVGQQERSSWGGDFKAEISNRSWPGADLGEEQSGRGNSKGPGSLEELEDSVWLLLGKETSVGQEEKRSERLMELGKDFGISF